MPYDATDTITAIASASGPAARGIIRLAGPKVVEVLAACLSAPASRPRGGLAPPAARRLALRQPAVINIDATPSEPPLRIPGHLFLWPTERSYTRQPSAEFHTIGSPPLLAAIVEQLTRAGARLAEPGEFTLRAFLAGRIDLVQAEAVLGVIDARGQADLDAALDQLAGGLSRPLHELRERLLGILADLEAGLDFVDEDIQFISRDDLSRQVSSAQSEVAALTAQMRTRETPTTAPRVALVGPPNAGKSSLFNALVERYGHRRAAALVSPEPGVTRDWLVARLTVNGVQFDLIDTAGRDEAPGDAIHHAAQRGAEETGRRADLRLHCIESNPPPLQGGARGGTAPLASLDLLVLTKVDQSPAPADCHSAPSSWPRGGLALPTSATSGEGLEQLAHGIATRIQSLDNETTHPASSTAASARTLETLAAAELALIAAASLTAASADVNEDLIAAELRLALGALAQVTGAATTDDLLDAIFSKFCIGK